MTDRELLELAAKAAGIKYDPEASKPHPVSGVWFGLWLTYDREPTEYDRRRWNPLEDDGDALRLAVKLRLHILHNDRGEPVLWVSAVLNKTLTHAAEEFSHESQRAAATRRAIVRAAAEIGRAS